MQADIVKATSTNKKFYLAILSLINFWEKSSIMPSDFQSVLKHVLVTHHAEAGESDSSQPNCTTELKRCLGVK